MLDCCREMFRYRNVEEGYETLDADHIKTLLDSMTHYLDCPGAWLICMFQHVAELEHATPELMAVALEAEAQKVRGHWVNPLFQIERESISTIGQWFDRS